MCVIAAVEDRLYVLDPFEAVQQVCVCVYPSALVLVCVCTSTVRRYECCYECHPLPPPPQTVVCKKDPPLYWAEVAVSLNGKAVALIDKGGYIWGGSPDFKVGN